jgi:hypothetical protein
MSEFCLEDVNIDFEPYKDENGGNVAYTPDSAGFKSRGTGHMPKLRLMSKINHTEGAPIGFSFLCERTEQDATCMMDISKFSGKNITFTAYVMTEDTEIAIGLDTGESTELKRVASNGDWTPVSINFDVPEKLSSAFIYFETNGAAKLYIDDVSVIYTKDGEEPAPVVGEETTTENTENTDTTENNGTTDTEITDNPETTPAPEVTPAVVDTKKTDENSNTTTYIAIGLIILGALLLGYAGVLIAANKKK